MDSEQLRITGLTGVEVTLDVAGAGTRSYAFIIDWHIRLLIALAWLLPMLLIAARTSGAQAMRTIAIYPAAFIYFFYHPVLEVLLRGTTPGKRMASVRIVTRNGGTPSVGALIIRNLFRLLDSIPGLYLVGLICCLVTAQRVRIGDMAAGTLLVLNKSPSTRSLAQLGRLVTQSGLTPQVAELVDDVLTRWQSLELQKRDAVARAILSGADPTQTPQELSALSDTELHRRLQALLTGGS